ncbi:TPA: hypothetical protein EYP26_00665 [Candidatus Bathyarchaeota archaeon]|nr:hypothetical protein [Candidatus Bathyarchaeota archaeon]
MFLVIYTAPKVGEQAKRIKFYRALRKAMADTKAEKSTNNVIKVKNRDGAIALRKVIARNGGKARVYRVLQEIGSARRAKP